jgi:uncharacterized coiled-coil protein SlyX
MYAGFRRIQKLPPPNQEKFWRFFLTHPQVFWQKGRYPKKQPKKTQNKKDKRSCEQKKESIMKPLIKLKTTTLLVIPLVLAGFALLPRAQAQTPAEGVTPFEALPGFNTRDGFNALDSLTTGTFNSAFGAFALEDTTSGSHNTALGAQALRNNTLGSFNTAVGENALVFNIDGNQNMALGQGALANNVTGDNNTAMGFQALNVTTASNNVAVGTQAGKNGTGASFIFNTAVGYQALLSMTGGNANVAIGDLALVNKTSGQFNTAIGAATGFFNQTGNNNIYIGQGAFGVANESFHTYIQNIYSTPVGAARPVRVLSNNLLGTFEASSRRFKDDIKPMDEASKALFALKPVTYHYKKELDATGGTLQYGLVAEEVAEVMPGLVYRDERGEVDGVMYESINVMLLNEFLKEHKKVEEQQASIAELKSTVALQQKGMEVLTAQLKEQAAQIQKVSAQLEVSKVAPRTVATK